MKRFEVLAEELQNFKMMEDFQQECIVDYINCPCIPDCEYNGKNGEVCNNCKINWLLGEWDDWKGQVSRNDER